DHDDSAPHSTHDTHSSDLGYVSPPSWRREQKRTMRPRRICAVSPSRCPTSPGGSAEQRRATPGRGSGPDHELGGVFQDLRDVGEDARTEPAVDEAVVDAQGKLGHLTGLDLALVDPGLLAHGTEGEDRGLAR